MSASRLEAFLAKLYVDESARAKFLADPRDEAMKAGLTAQEIEAVEKIDRVGLALFTQSLARKHQRRFAKPSGSKGQQRGLGSARGRG
jgi:hypothetical protein